MKEVTTFRFIEEVAHTNSAPMRFICKGDGLEEYLVKYIATPKEFDCLVYELLGSAFANYFGVPTPQVALVHAIEDSFGDELKRNRDRFVPGVIAFGSKVVPNADIILEMDVVRTKPHYKRFKNPLDLVTIAMMDLLIGNSDRWEENYNILVQKGGLFTFYAIDHFYCFGGAEHLGKFTSDLAVNVNQTVLRSAHCNALLRFASPNEIKEVVNRFLYLCKDKNAISGLVADVFGCVPASWAISDGLQTRVVEFVTDTKRHLRIHNAVADFLRHYNIQ